MQFHDLRFLYRLHTGLEAARSPEEAIAQTGKVLEEALCGFANAGTIISYRGREWRFGPPFRVGLFSFKQPLSIVREISVGSLGGFDYIFGSESIY